LKTDGAQPGQTLTMKEAMIQHRASPACSGCHARMDPIGFAMENFDAIGKWRVSESGNPLAARDGVPGLQKMLLGRSCEFVSAVTEKLLMYAVGRNLQYYDAPAIREIVHTAAPGNYKFSALVLGVVKSVPFQMRKSAS